jgi:hypothetical protein
MAEAKRLGFYFVRLDGFYATVELTTAGLVATQPDQPTRTWLWAQAASARATAQGLVITFTDGGELPVTLSDRAEVAEFVTTVRALAGSRPAEQPLEPERIAAWLGLAPGGTLVVRDVRNSRLWAAAAVLAIVITFLLGLRLHGPLVVIPLQWLWTLLIGVAMVSWGASDRVTADGQGLTARRGRRRMQIAWSEITSIAGVGWYWDLKTTKGVIRLPLGRSGQRLQRLASRILALRKAGVQLPGQTPVSEVSLSRMTGADHDAALGLSVAASGADAPTALP